MVRFRRESTVDPTSHSGYDHRENRVSGVSQSADIPGPESEETDEKKGVKRSMSTTRQEARGRSGSRFYPIPGHINYGITNLGDVVRFDTAERVDWDVEDEKNIYVRLDDERIPIQNALAAALMGPVNVPIVTGSKVYDGGRIRYVILPTFLRFEPPNIVFVRDTEFRVVPRTNGRIYVSAKGAVLDVFEMAIVRRKYNVHDNLSIFIKNPGGDVLMNYPSLARLIYEAWVGPVSSEERIEYSDGNSHNCVLENLHLLSAEDIMKSVLLEGNVVRGMPRWTFEDMEEAAELMSKGYVNAEISRILGVPRDRYFDAVLRRLRGGNSYYGCGAKYNYDLYHGATLASHGGTKCQRARNPKDYYDARTLMKLVESGMSYRQVASYMGMDYDDARTVIDILRRERRDESTQPMFVDEDMAARYRKFGCLQEVADVRDGGLDRDPNFLPDPDDTEADIVIDLGEIVEAQDVVITMRRQQAEATVEAEREGHSVVIEDPKGKRDIARIEATLKLTELDRDPEVELDPSDSNKTEEPTDDSTPESSTKETIESDAEESENTEN